MAGDNGYKAWTEQAQRVSAQLQDVTQELDDTRRQLNLSHKVVRSQRRLSWLLMGILLLLLIIAVGNRGTVKKIDSCINPKGTCAEQANKKTAAAVKQITDRDEKRFEDLRALIEQTHGLHQTATTMTGRHTTTSAPRHTASTTTSRTVQASPPTTTTTSASKQNGTTSTTTTAPPATTTTSGLCVGPVCLQGN